MPTYSARCQKCGTELDYIRKIADREDTPTHCENRMSRVLTTAMVPQVGIACGRSETLKDMAKKGLVPASDMVGEAEYRMKSIKSDIDSKKRDIVSHIVKTNGG